MKTRLKPKWATASLVPVLAARIALGADAGEVIPPSDRTQSAAQNQPAASMQDELAALKAQLAAQQAQIEQLRMALGEQNRRLGFKTSSEPEEKPSGFTLPSERLGEVASNAAVIPGTAPLPASIRRASLNQAGNQADAEAPSPLSLKIGESYLTPVGFMDLTYVERSTNNGGGIGTNFGSIPYKNTVAGHQLDGYLSTQNSRLGARFDTIVHGAKVIGYWESDFLGNNGGNVLVTSNSNTFRLRLYWVDVRKDKFELLGGQSWSLITPGRRGISPLPGDIFYSQDIDVNYQVGLPWERVATARFVYHPSDTVAFAVAAENSQYYIGGSGGGGTPTLPTSLTSLAGTQLNNGTTALSAPTLHPDFVSKLAFDPVLGGHLLHMEVDGQVSSFRVYNPNADNYYTKTGGGGGFNMNLELIKGGKFRLIENTFGGHGIGRLFFGTAPDLALNPNGNPALVPSLGTVDGFESLITPNFLLYGYYGLTYIGREVILDANGKALVGYGYPGSSNSQNRSIQEGTFGFQQTFWRDPKWGALQFFFQYSYLTRNPWVVGTGNPSQAKENMFFVNLRYALPGAAPNLKP